MTTRPIAFALATLLMLGFSAASAHDYKIGSLQIIHPWARATPKGAPTGGGYLKIVNNGTEPDRLIGGSFPIAGKVEVHEMSMDNGVMKMRPLKDGLTIAPGATVELKPGSFHIMFVGLTQPIKEGDHIKGTLVFEKAGTVEIEYSVVPIGSSPTQSSDHDHGMPSGHTH